jgi:hypothetical protein
MVGSFHWGQQRILGHQAILACGFPGRALGHNRRMTLPVSLVLIAVGAILVWGVTTDAEGLNVDAIGVILMVVGLIGLLFSLIFWDRWGWGAYRRRSTYVEGEPVVRRRVVEPAATTHVVEEVDEAGPPPAAGPPPP